MEKRNFTRVHFETEATVFFRGTKIRGEVRDLSLKGLFLETSESIPPGESLEIKISLSGASSELSIRLKGTSVRQEHDGVAVGFQEMDLDSFIHLRNTIAYNRVDEEEVMDEVFRFIEGKNKEEQTFG